MKDIRQATRKQYSAEEKIRILLAAFGVSTASRSCAVARVLPSVYSRDVFPEPDWGVMELSSANAAGFVPCQSTPLDL